MTDRTAAPTYSRTAVHGRSSDRLRPPRPPRRGGLALLAALVGVALLAAGIHAGRLFLNDLDDSYLGTDGWPSQGQGAYRIGDEPPAASAGQSPAPIASLAKVMTAYLVLESMPLEDGDDGPLIDVTDADVIDTQHRRALDQSLVDLDAHIDLTERDALMALLLPSANNVAALLARTVAGSVDAFVARMNDKADDLGMHRTTYTDPSGYDDGTVSTATDQLILAQVAASHRTLSAMMATPTYWIPVAGEISNTDELLGLDGFVGMKTGSHDEAGGCFMFHAVRILDGRAVDVIGVVMGQRGPGRLSDAAQAAARQLIAGIGTA